MPAQNIVLFTDAKGDYTMYDLIRAAQSQTDDPERQRLLVEAYLAGHAGFMPYRKKVTQEV